MRKSGVLTVLLAGVLTLGASAARGQGGACPSNAQYTNPANPTGPLVTLASLGVTSCFYIAANGSDSNDGKSEASGHPWLHAPDMPNCTGTCAATTPVAGEGFIFRGGDTWHYFTGSPQIGLPAGWPTGANGYAWRWTQSGTATNPIYIGVDQTWFTGGAWTRPVITNDNAIFTPTAPSLTNFASTSVSSCTFPQGNLDDIAFTGPAFFIFDNFEFTGMCWNDSSTNGSNNSNEHAYIKQYQNGGTGTSPRWFLNLYSHGWSHTTFAGCSNTPSVGACSGPGTFAGSTSQSNFGAVFAFNVTDGADSDDLTWGCWANDAYDIEESVCRHVGGTMIFDNCHSHHDNLWEYINNGNDGGTHMDLDFCVSEANVAGGNFYYNNLVRFVATEYSQAALSAVFWWGGTPSGATCGGVTCVDYVFNNVGHDVNCNGNCNDFGGPSTGLGTGGVTNFLFYNNTWESPLNFQIWRQQQPGITITTANNHYITDNNGSGFNCASVWLLTASVNGGAASCSGDFFQTILAANLAGYTSANDYAPISSSSPTVGAGANETSISGPFGAAFLKTTTAGCTESFVNIGFGSPTVVCPNVAPANRPTTGACPGLGCWNAGAFDFVSSTVALAPTPHAFAATALGSNSSDSPVTFTLTNNTGVTITGVTISFAGANPGDFTETTSCVTTLASSASCQIFVTFTPIAIGSRTATLSVSDSDASSPQTSSLSGTAISSVINPSPANPVTFGVVVTDPSIPSTVNNEKHSANLSVYNF